MNSVNNQPVYVQIVFNSDDETLFVLLIQDFIKLNIKAVTLDDVDHPLWHMIYWRFGRSNAALTMKINTLMMSYEFHLFIQLIIDNVIMDSDSISASKMLDTAQTPLSEKVNDLQVPMKVQDSKKSSGKIGVGRLNSGQVSLDKSGKIGSPKGKVLSGMVKQ